MAARPSPMPPACCGQAMPIFFINAWPFFEEEGFVATLISPNPQTALGSQGLLRGIGRKPLFWLFVGRVVFEIVRVAKTFARTVFPRLR